MPTRRSATIVKGFGRQAKIHTRNNVGASGKIYFGTKQGYPDKSEKREDYPGGYPMVYDPRPARRRSTRSRSRTTASTASRPTSSAASPTSPPAPTTAPAPARTRIFLVLDLKTGKYRDLIDTQHIYGFIVVDHLGRAYHPMLGGDIVRYDPKTDKLERLKQTIDGKPPTPESHLADADGPPDQLGHHARRQDALLRCR